jgi:hypothetical protein
MEMVCKPAEASRRISRVLRAKVNPTEYCVLTFIYDRTYAFGKADEAIPQWHFLHGIPEIPMCGLNMAERTLRDALQRLIKKGYVEITGGTTNVKKYSINPGLILAAPVLPLPRSKSISELKTQGNPKMKVRRVPILPKGVPILPEARQILPPRNARVITRAIT